MAEEKMASEREAQAARVTAFCLAGFQAPDLHFSLLAMRDHDEDDPKKPRPVRIPKKDGSLAEAEEPSPWQPIEQDVSRDRRRHV